MTQTEQQEGNRMIAEYCGAVFCTKPNENILYCPPENTPVQYVSNLEDLKYHSDERWLNPVAKRVKEELIDKRLNDVENNTIEKVSKYLKLTQDIDKAAITFQIEKLFPAVVRTITFLNSIYHKETR